MRIEAVRAHLHFCFDEQKINSYFLLLIHSFSRHVQLYHMLKFQLVFTYLTTRHILSTTNVMDAEYSSSQPTVGKIPLMLLLLCV